MAEREGQQFGNYRLTRLLGKGAFAEVYLAVQVYLGTEAAVKILHAQLANPTEVEKFRVEARTIATLVHPHIVRVLDFGVQEGTPYLLMDYAPNGSLRQRFPAEQPLAPAVMLPYVKQVAEALHYAHEQKLIHRDIKPENMLLGRRGEVLLSDFGIALAAQSSSYQETQGVAGTAAYMAPEQLQGKPRPASDQYSLGIVVYEWLSGQRPFQGTFTEVAAQHVLAPPPPLRERVPTISPMLEQVVLTALAKDPKARFGSVRAFANALEQASLGESAQEYATRAQPLPGRPAPASPSAQPGQAVPSVFTAQTIISSLPPNAATPPVPPAYAPGSGLTQQSTVSSNPPPTYAPGSGLTQQSTISPSVPPTYAPGSGPPRQPSVPSSAPPASAPAYPAGWSSTPPAGVPSYDASTYGTPPPLAYPLAPTPGQAGPPPKRGVSRRTVLIAGVAGLGLIGGGAAALLLTSKTGGGTAQRGATPTPTGAATASPTATATATATPTETPTPTPPQPGDTLYTYRGHSSAVISLAWSPNGKRIATGSFDHSVRVWDALTGNHVLTYRGHSDQVWAVAWSPDGSKIASAGKDKTVQIWDASSGANITTYTGHSAEVAAVAWSPDSKLIASASYDNTVRVWEATTQQFVFTFTNHSDHVWAVAWSPDGSLVASGSKDKTVQVWNPTNGLGTIVFVYTGHTGGVDAVRWSASGQRIASGSYDHTAQVWDAITGNNVVTYTGHSNNVTALAWSPDGQRIVSASQDRTAQVWDASSANTVLTYSKHTGGVNDVGWSSTGQQIASASTDQTAQVWLAP